VVVWGKLIVWVMVSAERKAQMNIVIPADTGSLTIHVSSINQASPMAGFIILNNKGGKSKSVACFGRQMLCRAC